MKKLVKLIGILFLTILLVLIVVPFLFQNQITEAVKTYLNNNVNADVDFDDVSLSLLISFPKANVQVDNLKIINDEPFKGETLATAKIISFDMSVKELFKKPSDDPIIVNSIEISEALLTLKTDKFGNNNYDISKKTDSISSDLSKRNFKFNIEDYAIINSALSYLDETSNLKINITELNHSGKGTFSTSVSELDTQSEANVSLNIDSTTYLNNNTIKLKALIDLDLIQNTYTFKENTGFINQLPLEFNGFIKQLDEGQEINIAFKNTGSSFKDFLAIIPSEYSKNLEEVKTKGDFKINGIIKGFNTETTIPNFDISIASNNASLRFPDLPKSVDNILIDANILNNTGNLDDTYVKIKNLKFEIDDDSFSSSATLKNLFKNIMVDANIDGTLNLANISKAYPIEVKNDLSGILKGKLHTVFDMNAIETNAHERIKNNGNIAVTDFIYSSKDLVNPISISKSEMLFNPGIVTLQSFESTTGKSDISATGKIKNLIGFLLSDKNLQGDFIVSSNMFVVSDFMVEEGHESEKNKGKSLKIPAYLDCTINAEAKTVQYDNLTLKDVKGVLKIKNEQATLENMSSTIFDGILTLNGLVNTQPDTPTFNMDLGVYHFDISQSFNDMDLFQGLAPIAKLLKGKLNSTLSMSGNLTKDFTPKLNSISGDAFAELLTSTFNPKNEAFFHQLKGALSFIDFDKLDLNDVKTNLHFENGTVNVKPFNLQYQDIAILVEGNHSFEKKLNYKVVLDVPAKYLGTEINNLIEKIDEDAFTKITIPVTASISGSLANPKVSTDLTSGIAKLTEQLLNIQKEKLINQGKDQVKDILENVLGQKTGDSDTTNTQKSKSVKDALDEIIQGNNSKVDSTLPGNPIKDVLGGILKGKNKEQDTVN